MDDIRSRLDTFAALPPEEQRRVRAYVADHPEWSAALDEAELLARVLAAPRPPGAAPDATDLADYLAALHLGDDPLQGPDADRFVRVSEALGEHPAYEQERMEMAQHLDHLTDETESPAALFERLSGRTLRPARRSPLRLVPLGRYVAAAAAVVLVAYVALVAVSAARVSERARVADLVEVSDFYMGITLRGSESAAADPQERYGEALEALKEARSAPLGLFPSYDPARLDVVVAELDAVIAGEPVGSWLALEAHYVAGKVRLYQGRDGDAARRFRVVVDGEGLHAADARRALDWLESEAP